MCEMIHIGSDWQNAVEKYERIKFTVDKNGFVEISPRNAIRTMALILANRNYAKSYDKSIPKSSAEWFSKYKDEKVDFKKIEMLKEILVAINAENSTRVKVEYLEKVVLENLNEINDFESKLRKKEYEVFPTIYTLSGGKKYETTDKEQKILLSYASKFCHFYCWHMFKQDNGEISDIVDSFPIIDSIMRKIIPIYDYRINYGSENNKYEKYKKESCLYKYRETSYGSIPEKINGENYGVIGYYKDYVKALQGISEKTKVSVTGIEQLLWWYYKDIIDDVDVVNNKMKDKK